MRRLPVVLAIAWIASAHAAGNLTCSITPHVGGCYLERPVFTVGDFEVAVGVDAQAAWAGGRSGHLAPYASVAYYAPAWSAWVEVFVPQAARGIRVIGRPDWFRLGFTWRIP